MEKKITNIGFSLSKITTEQFAIIEDGFSDDGDMRLGTEIGFGADKSQKIIGVFASFKFESNKKAFIIIQIGCHFEITREAWEPMLDDDSDSLDVPKGFMRHLAMLTVGTTRGVLHAKTENTCFNKYLLPTINVSELIESDVAIQFENK